MPRTATRLFQTHVDIPEHARVRVIDCLNQQLADTSDLASQLKQSHWNVKGPEFMQLHELFDAQFARLLDSIDMIAERVVQLGGKANGTARMAAASSRLPELPNDIDRGLEYVAALVERYGELASSTRAAIDLADQAGDKDSADLFTEVSRALDKDLWFLEAHLQAKG